MERRTHWCVIMRRVNQINCVVGSSPCPECSIVCPRPRHRLHSRVRYTAAAAEALDASSFVAVSFYDSGDDSGGALNLNHSDSAIRNETLDFSGEEDNV